MNRSETILQLLENQENFYYGHLVSDKREHLSFEDCERFYHNNIIALANEVRGLLGVN
jgi:hypothetical protein